MKAQGCGSAFFDADLEPDPDPAQNLDADPDPDPDPGGGGGGAAAPPAQPKMCIPPGKILGTPLLSGNCIFVIAQSCDKISIGVFFILPIL